MQYGFGGAALAIGSAVLLSVTVYVLVKNPGAATEVKTIGHFNHGVASGHPHHRGVVLWTRVTPSNPPNSETSKINASEPLKVNWQVWEERDGSRSIATPVIKGETSARPDRDFTVKLDIRSDKLEPKVRYAFQFSAGSERSSIGHFRLPPAGDQPLDSLKYAVFSCSQWLAGYFNAYGAAAKEDLDFWLHVGDFMYEYGREKGEFKENDPDFVRGFDSLRHPEHETVTLDDYRERHALYRLDPELQQLSASAPLIPIWDDHDVANNAWSGGAANHNKGEGTWNARKIAGLLAYHEWMPTRHLAELVEEATVAKKAELWEAWRRIDFGDLASVLVLETRHSARSAPGKLDRQMTFDRIDDHLKSADYPPPEKWAGSKLEKDLLTLRADVHRQVNKDDNIMLGPEQIAWLENHVQNTSKQGVKWRLVAQSHVVHPMAAPDYQGAIEKSRAAGSVDLAEKWSRVLKNATSTGTCQDILKPVVCSNKRKHMVLNKLAAGRYQINMSFDDWMGSVAERDRFMNALSADKSSSTLVYGGDSHNAWAGTLRHPSSGEAVASHFAGQSVTSRGFEHYEKDAGIPADFDEAAWLAPNKDLEWVDLSHRGFMLISLTKDMHHLEYRAVDTKTKGNIASKCLAAFGVARGAGPKRVDCRPDKKATSFAQALSARRRGQAGLRHGRSPLSVSN